MGEILRLDLKKEIANLRICTKKAEHYNLRTKTKKLEEEETHNDGATRLELGRAEHDTRLSLTVSGFRLPSGPRPRSAAPPRSIAAKTWPETD